MNKLVMGLALGLTLVAGVSGTAEAKSKAVTVKVDKADASTAKKVDEAMKKGKAVTLKVRGSKKASRKLLVKLQGVVASTMRLNIHFDLDNGNKDREGFGNTFYTYKDLNYKQSGSYGCYTFSKSTCNAYKYDFKFVKRNVDKQMKSIDDAIAGYKIALDKAENAKTGVEAFKEYMQDEFEEISSRNWYTIDDVAYKFFEDLISTSISEALGDIAEGSMDKLAEEAKANGVSKGFVDKLVKEAKYYLKKHKISNEKREVKPLDEFIRDKYGVSAIKYRNGGSLEPDFSGALSLFIRALYLGDDGDNNSSMVYGNKAEYAGALRKMNKGDLLDGTDEFRFKSLVNKTAQGVCADYAMVNRALLDYMGCRSYYVVNDNVDVNHAVCAVAMDGQVVVINNYIFQTEEELNTGRFKDKSGWRKAFKEAMGNAYPF